MAEPEFPIFDRPMPRQETSDYSLPLEEWNQMVDLAHHLSAMDSKSMLRRRMATYLEATGRHSAHSSGTSE